MVQVVSFLETLDEIGEAAPHATPQSFFRVKEGSGVGKRVANKIADIGIVDEQVRLLLLLSHSIRLLSNYNYLLR